MPEATVSPISSILSSPLKLGITPPSHSSEVSKGGISELSLGTALETIARQSIRFDWVGVYELGQDGILNLRACTGDLPLHQRIPIGQGVCGRAVTENQDLNIGDVSKQPEYLACDLRTRAELVVLIRDSQGKIMGQVDIDSYTTGDFSAEEVNQVRAVAMELGRLWKSLEN